ncbi:MAG: xanthine dehydrogenase family protein molybdopterin-binding subunit, partial [Pseudorhodoplanes sp.]
MSSAGNESYVGRPVLRREDGWLLRGAGRFVDDVDVPADTLHLSFVLSPEPHATIENIDVSAAKALDGVVGILTGDDIARLVKPIRTEIDIQGYRLALRDVVARDRVRFVGEYVAVCIAETPYLALDAADRVTVSYSSLPSVSDALEAERDGAPVVHEELGDNVLLRHTFSTEGFEEAFASAPHVIEETFRLGRVAAVSIEPRGVVAIPERVGSSLVVYTSTQVPHIVRSAIAEFVGIPESRIRVVVPDVGGGFGMKAHVYPDELIVAALAWKYRRPVKWIQDRREDLLTNAQARDHRLKLSVSFDESGAIVAMKNEVTTNAGAYSSYPFGCTLEPLGAARMSVGPYRIRNYRFLTRAIATHTCPTGAYRGTGSVSAFVAIEGMMDRIARKLGVDPAEIRARNLVTQEEMPYVNALGVRYDTGSYQESLQMAKQAIGYDDYRARQPADRLVDGKYRGIGIASFVEVSGIGAKGWAARGVRAITGYDSANIKVEPSGHVTAFISQAAAGQSHLTTFAQIVADHLGARFEDITVMEGDTASAPYGSNTMASRGAVAAGGATILASRSLNDKMRRIAADLLEASAEDIELRDGMATVVGTELSVSFKDIAQTAYSMTQKRLPEGEQYGLESFEIYDPPPVTLANSTHIVTVSVGADDGVVEIERY